MFTPLPCVNSGANNLNRKVEANVAVGSEFGNVSKLWKEVRPASSCKRVPVRF